MNIKGEMSKMLQNFEFVLKKEEEEKKDKYETVPEIIIENPEEPMTATLKRPKSHKSLF